MEYAIVKLKLSSKYLSFPDWMERYEETLDIYYQESGCNTDTTMSFEEWARGFYNDCLRWDEYQRNE